MCAPRARRRRRAPRREARFCVMDFRTARNIRARRRRPVVQNPLEHATRRLAVARKRPGDGLAPATSEVSTPRRDVGPVHVRADEVRVVLSTCARRCPSPPPTRRRAPPAAARATRPPAPDAPSATSDLSAPPFSDRPFTNCRQRASRSFSLMKSQADHRARGEGRLVLLSRRPRRATRAARAPARGCSGLGSAPNHLMRKLEISRNA